MKNNWFKHFYKYCWFKKKYIDCVVFTVILLVEPYNHKETMLKVDFVRCHIFIGTFQVF